MICFDIIKSPVSSKSFVYITYNLKIISLSLYTKNYILYYLTAFVYGINHISTKHRIYIVFIPYLLAVHNQPRRRFISIKDLLLYEREDGKNDHSIN